MNRLIALICFAALLAAAPSAAAAPLNELPFEQRRAAAGCLQATGAPGAFATLGAYSRRDSATELRTVGTGERLSVSVGRLTSCAAVAEAAGGAAIVAGAAVSPDFTAELRATLRDPGGAFGPAVTLHDDYAVPAAAIAPSGAAAVAWIAGAEQSQRLLVARRTPGGAFGAPETAASWTAHAFRTIEVQAAIDAAGTVTVLVTRELGGGSRRVLTATAMPGAPFAVQRLATTNRDDAVLAVAHDGWAMVTHSDRGDEALPKVYERAPGAASFTAVSLPRALPADESHGWSYGAPALAVRDGGGAIVAWRTGPFESLSGVDAMTRETAGPFTARRVAEPLGLKDFESDDDGLEVSGLLDPFAGPPVGFEPAGLEAALAPDGRIVLAWPAPAGRRPLAVTTTRAAVGNLGGTFERARTLGSPMRDAGDIAALFAADGRAAVAWADNASGGRAGRLHVAVEGAPARAPVPRPRVRVTAQVVQRLYPSQPLKVLVTCSHPCDVRATVRGPGGVAGERSATRRLRAIHTISAGAVPGLRPGRQKVRVLVYAAAAGGHRTRIFSFRIPVIGLRPLPVRAPREVRAERDGDAIVVTWRTAAPARRQTFIVIGAHGRRELAQPGAVAFRDGAGRRRHRVRLRPTDPDRVRVVTLFTEGYDARGEDTGLTTVRVR